MLKLAVVALLLAGAVLAPSIKAWLEKERPNRVPAGVYLVAAPDPAAPAAGTTGEMAVGGMAEEELRAAVHDVARRVDRPPADARWDARAGVAVPDREGVAVDVEATISACLNARRKARVGLVLLPLPAGVRTSLFEEVDRGNPQKRTISLMFNVAWGEEYLDGILDRLEEDGIRSTFFFDGAWVEKFPGRVRAIANRGHEIANHGYRHDHVLDLPEAPLKDLIRKNEDLLRRVSGAEPSRLFAPPYGERNQRIVGWAAELGYYTVMWTIDTLDWRRPPPEKIADKVLANVVNGALVLMHPTEETAKALDLLLPELEAEGFQLVTVSDAIAGEGGPSVNLSVSPYSGSQ